MYYIYQFLYISFYHRVVAVPALIPPTLLCTHDRLGHFRGLSNTDVVPGIDAELVLTALQQILYGVGWSLNGRLVYPHPPWSTHLYVVYNVTHSKKMIIYETIEIEIHN